MTYLITFSCYGSHTHGADEGSVDLNHNHYGAPLVQPNPRRLTAELNLMDQLPYQLNRPRRQAVLEAIVNRCTQSDWNLRAAHVRQNHVHIIVDSHQTPEFVMTQLKSAASRRLNHLGFDDRTRKRWSRHGSTRMLWGHESVQKAIRYVLNSQGDPMSTFPS
jgi:REP element-mobilizing transposase RayT